MKIRSQQPFAAGIIRSAAIILPLLLLMGCGGGASSTDKGADSTATAPKVYGNGDLHVVGHKGDMHFETYGGEKAFNGAKFHFARDFFMGYAPVSKMVNGKELHGILNLKGEEAIKIEHEEFVDMYEDGYFRIGSMDKQGYLDSTGKLVIPMEYSGSNGVFGGLFVMKKGLKCGVLNTKAEEVVPFIYDKAYGYSEEGLMMVEQRYKCGFVDRTGKLVIPCTYESATSYEKGLAIARKGKKYGLIDVNNATVSPFEYDEFKWETTSYEDKGSETGFINVGKRFICTGDYIILRKGDKWGVIDLKGQVLVPFEYDYVGGEEQGGIMVGNGDKRGNFNFKTKEVKWH
ncbi:MAG: WG repeat-containing protein [Bacteroidia bacterium]